MKSPKPQPAIVDHTAPPITTRIAALMRGDYVVALDTKTNVASVQRGNSAPVRVQLPDPKETEGPYLTACLQRLRDNGFPVTL